MATRYAIIEKSWATKTAAYTTARYLPGNYHVVHETAKHIYLAGEDYAGWTLDEYVIPRLASGMIFATEIKESEVPDDALS